MNKKMSLALVSLLSLSFISCTNKNNNETFYQIEKGLYVNALPGFYDEGFDLKFKFDNKESKVYYSLDSSIPTESSLLYDKSIYIDKVSSKDKKDYPLTTSVTIATSLTFLANTPKWSKLDAKANKPYREILP